MRDLEVFSLPNPAHFSTAAAPPYQHVSYV
jgi:hypothetical protein